MLNAKTTASKSWAIRSVLAPVQPDCVVWPKRLGLSGQQPASSSAWAPVSIQCVRVTARSEMESVDKPAALAFVLERHPAQLVEEVKGDRR